MAPCAWDVDCATQCRRKDRQGKRMQTTCQALDHGLANPVTYGTLYPPVSSRGRSSRGRRLSPSAPAPPASAAGRPAAAPPPRLGPGSCCMEDVLYDSLMVGCTTAMGGSPGPPFACVGSKGGPREAHATCDMRVQCAWQLLPRAGQADEATGATKPFQPPQHTLRHTCLPEAQPRCASQPARK